MATATVSRTAGVSPWVAAALAARVSRADLIQELSVALDDEIRAYPEFAESKVQAGLDRFAALDPALADELDVDDLVAIDMYCATVRATLAAVLARSEGTTS